jgi:hypothetical protein
VAISDAPISSTDTRRTVRAMGVTGGSPFLIDKRDRHA